MIARIKHVGRRWRIKHGLLYAGLVGGVMAALVGPDEALVFDDRDRKEDKLMFYSVLFSLDFEIEFIDEL